MAAIHQAALQGNTDCINLLINNGAQADIEDNKGITATLGSYLSVCLLRLESSCCLLACSCLYRLQSIKLVAVIVIHCLIFLQDILISPLQNCYLFVQE